MLQRQTLSVQNGSSVEFDVRVFQNHVYVNGRFVFSSESMIVTVYSVYDSFAKAGGLSLILLTVPATTSLLAWGRKVSEYVLISNISPTCRPSGVAC